MIKSATAAKARMLKAATIVKQPYKLGRVMNKYIILEIMAYADEFPQGVETLCGSSKTLRRLMITNMQASLAIF